MEVLGKVLNDLVEVVFFFAGRILVAMALIVLVVIMFMVVVMTMVIVVMVIVFMVIVVMVVMVMIIVPMMYFLSSKHLLPCALSSFSLSFSFRCLRSILDLNLVINDWVLSLGTGLKYLLSFNQALLLGFISRNFLLCHMMIVMFVIIVIMLMIVPVTMLLMGVAVVTMALDQDEQADDEQADIVVLHRYHNFKSEEVI